MESKELFTKNSSTGKSAIKAFCRFRYDKTEIAVKWTPEIEKTWKSTEQRVFDLIKMLMDENECPVKCGSPKKGIYKYCSYRIFESRTERIEIFYGRFQREETESEPVWAYFRITCKDKTMGYANHCSTILAIENGLKSLGLPSYLRYAELCLDFPDREFFDRIYQDILFSWGGIDYGYWQKSPDGKKGHRGNGFDPNKESLFAKYKYSPRELTMYIKTEEGLTRHRLEMLVQRDYLERQGVNTFSELLERGPDFLLRHISLREFDLEKILKLGEVYNSAGTCPKFFRKSRKFFERLTEKSAAEVLCSLTLLLKGHMGQYQIKRNLSREITFPQIVQDTPINNVGRINKRKKKRESRSSLKRRENAK